MKRFFLYLLLGGGMLLTACNWTPGQRQGQDSPDAEAVEPGGGERDADLPDLSGLEGVLKKLGGLLESLEQAEDQARADADRARYEQEEPATEEPATEDFWYNHDFALVYVQHKYATATRPTPDLDETYRITRVGDKVYLQYSLKGVVQKTSVYESIPEGYKETIYKRGKVDWEHTFEGNSLNGEVRYLLRNKYPVAVDLPEGVDLRRAKEGTCLGRPCRIAELEEAQGTTTYYIDKEYGFFYKATQVGPAVNMTPFELTYFTDRPTAKDIPDTSRSDNPADQLKKQLQGQLDAIRQ